jgi:SprT protein
VSEILCQELRTATQHWLQRAAPLLLGHGRSLPAIQVRCDLRGKSAGQVRHAADGNLVIRYNLGIARLQPAAFLEQTVPHEVAHVVTWLLHGASARPHGREWRAVMAFFDQKTAARCHDFEVPAGHTRRQQRWHYQCDCREHRLSTTRHRRIQQGQQYQCRLCQGVLRPAVHEGPAAQ